jgi:hypothetical protein
MNEIILSIGVSIYELQKRKRHETSDTQNYLIDVSDRYYIHIRSLLRLRTTLNEKENDFFFQMNKIRYLIS